MTNTSRTLFSSEIADVNQAIPLGTLAYLRERTRARLYDYIVSKFLEKERSGLTKAQLARRIRHDPSVINRWLANPGNWTIDAVSDLLAGISAEELEPKSSLLLGRTPRNDTKPDWFVVSLSRPEAKREELPKADVTAATTSVNVREFRAELTHG